MCLGGADCRRPERSHSYLGSEDRPQRTVDSRTRGLSKCSAHRPRCQLHGSSQQLGESPRSRNWVLGHVISLKCFFLFFSRETVMFGTWLEASEKRWLNWFPRRRSPHTTATPSAASLAPIPRQYIKSPTLPALLYENTFLMSSLGCWLPAPLTRPARSGGRQTSRSWQSWASRATILERHLEAGCGTAPFLGTRNILSLVSQRPVVKGIAT